MTKLEKVKRSLSNAVKEVKSCARAIVESWFQIAKFWRYIIVASVVTYSIQFLDSIPYISKLENIGMGVAMTLHKNRPEMEQLSIQRNGVDGIVFLDINQAQYRAWGEPFYMPRDQSLALLKLVTSKAKVVLFDFDMQKRGINTNAEKTMADEDLAIKNFLESYSMENAPLLLVAGYKDEIYNGRLIREQKPFEYFDILQNNNIYVVRPEYRTDSDGIVRSFLLAQIVCDGLENSVLSLSPSLAIDLLLNNSNPKNIWETQKACGDTTAQLPESISYGEKGDIREVNLAGKGDIQKILFTLDSSEEANATKQYRRITASKLLNTEGAFLTESEHQKMLDAVLKNKVVVVGSSYIEGGDILNTPVGFMPGALVIVNATKSLMQWGQLETPSIFVKLLLLLPMIIFVAWCYTHLSPLVATGVVWSVVGIVFIGGSLILIETGLWLDFATPLLTIEVHRMASKLFGNER